MRIEKKVLADGTTQYRARPIIDGKKLAVRGKTKGEVEEIVADLKRKQKRRRLGLPDRDERPLDVTYGELVSKVLDTYKHSEQSKQALSFNLKRSQDEYENVLVRELLPESIDAWLSRLPLATTTKRHTLKAMRYALKRAVTWGYRPDNPAAVVEMPPEQDYEAHPFQSWDEVRLVATRFKSVRDTALVLFVCATGLRSQEWLALRWSDIDLAKRRLRVNRTVQDGKIVEAKAKTRGSLRYVLLDDIALEALALLPTPLNRDQLVFPGVRSGILDLKKWREGCWTKALAAAELDYRAPSGMRDTFATLAIADGAPLEWVSKQMGHSSTAVTEKHYFRWLDRGERRILDALNAARSQTGLKSDSLAEEAR